MKINKQTILQLIKEEPAEIGRWVGFKDLTDLHNEWLKQFLFADADQTLQAHRGSYKTTILSLFLTIHIIIKPNETVIYFRKTDTDVKEITKQVMNIFQTGCIQEIVRIIYNKDLQLLKHTANEIQTNLGQSVKGGSQILGLGIGSSITGKHADIICTDDIVNLNDRISRTERERTKSAYMELQNIKNRGGRFINTGTPWHKDDCFVLMPEAKKYTWRDTGLISEDEAREIKGHMTNSLFSANYELRHIPEDDVIFTDPKQGEDIEKAMQGWAHLDAAYYGEDYTAFTALNIHDGKYYVFGKCWRKHIDNVMEEVVKYYQEMKASILFNELNADKGYVAKKLREKDVRVSTYHESQNKFIKIVSYLKFEWQNIVFVKGTDPEYIQQIVDYTENAEHDDCPDSLASLVRKVGKRKRL